MVTGLGAAEEEGRPSLGGLMDGGGRRWQAEITITESSRIGIGGTGL